MNENEPLLKKASADVWNKNPFQPLFIFLYYDVKKKKIKPALRVGKMALFPASFCTHGTP